METSIEKKRFARSPYPPFRRVRHLLSTIILNTTKDFLHPKQVNINFFNCQGGTV